MSFSGRALVARGDAVVVHLSHRSDWLRAAVLGANDGILSTASLVLGVAASGASGAARELAAIYEQRGLEPALAEEVALAMSRRGALEAHTRDELGLDATRLARPVQAAWTSALSFAAGAALPLIVAWGAVAMAITAGIGTLVGTVA